MITSSLLQAICLTAEGKKACLQYLQPLQANMPKFGIDSPVRQAAFLAQIAHESQDFTRVVENLNYSAQGLANTWPSRFAVDPKAKIKTPNALAKSLHRRPEAIANSVYASRMGNGPESSGDGWAHRGAGLKQLTGKDNHRAFGEAVGIPLEQVPAYLQTPEGAALSACWFWKVNKLGALADRGDFEGLTRKVNGGTIGLKERYAYLKRAVDSWATMA